MNNKWIILVAFLSLNAFSQVLSVEGGTSYLLGDLQKEVQNHPYGGLGFELGLSDYTTGYLHSAFSYVKLKNNSDFHGLYQFIGRAGIETSEKLFQFEIGRASCRERV